MHYRRQLDKHKPIYEFIKESRIEPADAKKASIPKPVRLTKSQKIIFNPKFSIQEQKRDEPSRA